MAAGTPNVIVNGKYRIAPQQAKSFPRMIAIMNHLIDKESSGQGRPISVSI